jgi:hypothetical protein
MSISKQNVKAETTHQRQYRITPQMTTSMLSLAVCACTEAAHIDWYYFHILILSHLQQP